MTENTSTPYSTKLEILSDLWLNYRSDSEFIDFIEYNDMGLPLAYVIGEGIVQSSETAQRFIEETFDLLITALDVEDTGFENLDELLSVSMDSEPEE